MTGLSRDGGHEACPTVAVVLVNWNAWKDTTECLDTVLGLDYPYVSIWVVDNDSQDQSVEMISEWAKSPNRAPHWRDIAGVRRITGKANGESREISCRVVDEFGVPEGSSPEGSMVTIVRAARNLGFAGGNNLGISLAGLDQFDYFWLLNTDTIVDARSLSELVNHALSDKSYGMIGSTLLYYSDPARVQAMGGGKLNRQNTSVQHIGQDETVAAGRAQGATVETNMSYVVGASLLVSSKLIRSVGLMREDYFLYFEEIDWAMRSAGEFRLGYAPSSLVYHKVGQSSAKVASTFSLRLLYRNRLLFAARFFPDRLFATVWHLTSEMIRHFLRGRLRQGLILAGVLANTRRIVQLARKN